MNKIYALKHSHITGGLVAVSELSKKSVMKILPMVVGLISICFINKSYTAQLYIDKVWARDYLDLAQNKGIFKPGISNVSIQLKDGNTFTFPELPIPDFTPAANNGATTSIGGAYAISAAHYAANHVGIATSSWAQTNYKKVDRMTNNDDFAVHRLNKFVVETTGTSGITNFNLTKDEALERYGVDFNGSRQIIGFRAGSGSTSVIKNNSKYETGEMHKGDLLSASIFQIDWNNKDRMYTDKTVFKNTPIYGDSGSVAYLYDNKEKKWVAFGAAHYIAINNNNQTIFTRHSKYSESLVNNIKEHFTQKVPLNGKMLRLGNEEYSIDEQKTPIGHTNVSGPKDLIFSGSGSILLTDNIDLQNGGMIFDENEKYEVKSNNDNIYTFKGAGLDIGKGSFVNWDVKYAQNDPLHKIGEGELNVTRTQNTNLKTGNGTVILSANKAFNNIYMVNGLPTVKVNAENSLSAGDYAGIYFSERGGTLDLNGYNQEFKKIAATDSGATITNTSENESLLKITNKDNYIYHGNINGNIQLVHINEDKNNNGRLILDGDINVNKITIRNALLAMQGHATDHAVFRDGAFSCKYPLTWLCGKDYAQEIKNIESEENKKMNSEYKSNNKVSDFTQPDWEHRKFIFDNMNIENTTLSIARNANVEGDIYAINSDIKIGDKTTYIDSHSGKNITGDGFAFRQDVKSGTSTGDSKFTGGIISTGGSIDIGDKAIVDFNTPSSLDNTALTIHKGAKVTASSSLFTITDIKSGGELTLTGNTVNGKVIAPSLFYAAEGYALTEDEASFTAKNQASVNGDIKSDKAAKLSFGSADEGDAATTDSRFALALLDGFDTSYQGSINAAQSRLAMNNALWKVTGNSVLKSLNSTGSMVLFNGGRNTFNTLTVDELTTSNSAFVMRTNLEKSDQLIVKNKLDGKDNILMVDFLEKKTSPNNALNIDLVSAPKETSGDVFKATTQSIGFSDVTPEIKQQEKDGKSVWTLTGYKTVANADAAKKATSLMSGGYKAFLAEVNNLNKRMGDLRDINGEAGAWARIMSGTGSADGGFSDNYTHVQVGADKKHELDGLDLFTGVTMTYTDSHAGSDAFSGETKSVGAGIYASAMFESGAYIDLIGKFVHHDNEYTAAFAGLGTRDYSSHSWYAGAEVGYRYHVTDDTWIEPQAELVYGAVSGKQFSWKDQGMNLTMKDKDFNPLIGRTGLDVGKSFTGKDWKVTARAGLGYQFDLFANGETVLRDASGEKRIKGEKDGRMLMNVGLNSEIRDNLRFGLEFEKSAFGKYNVDNAINANFRYSF